MSADGPPASGSMPQAESPSLVGEILGGRYRLIKKLGEGGMGEVYAAEHQHIEKRYAIKLLRPEIVSNKDAVKRFYQEARSSSSIGHRNIIAIDDFGELPDGRLYMCMELLEGAPLNELITQPQTLDRLLNILIQTGHGLAAAHAKNIVHRDMKPENIFVTVGPNREDIPKLLDFGIAKVSGNDGQNNLTRTGTIFGTPFYMAPEQALGNPVDARTDIYAMGVIMYEVFAGSLPFQGESFMGILTQHITTEPEPVAQRAAKAGRQLPPALADIVTRCMQKNPAHRFATMDELVNALVQIYRGVAGPGMSTYMEAFPVSTSHPVSTPPPTGMAAAQSPTIAVGAPGGYGAPHPGYSAPPHHHTTPTPSASVPVSASGSGMYDPAASHVAPKKSSAGLIIALVAVLLIGGGAAAFFVLDSGKKAAAGDGNGSQALGSGSAQQDAAGSAIAHNGSNAPDPTDHHGSNAAGSDSAGSDAAGSNAAGSNVETPPPPVDAGVTAPKTVQVLVRGNAASFEIWEDGKKLIDGPNNIDVAQGAKRTLLIKAKGYKDKEIKVDSKKPTFDFKLTRAPGTTPGPGPGSNPPPPRCTNTKADLRDDYCRPIFCKAHPDDPACLVE
ncbi:MAG: serine/threonine protein kinase [Kofleriaceae bacterium]